MRSKLFPIFLTLSLIILGGAVVYFTNNREANDSVSITSSSLDLLIIKAEKLIQGESKNVSDYLTLISLYFQKIRETGDVSYYAKIENLIKEAEKVSSNDPNLLSAKASLEIGRHNFRNALEIIRKAISLNDRIAVYYGIKGDAELELGMYDDAITSFQKMVDLRPNFGSFSRIAYIREIYGDTSGAIKSLDEAVSSGSSHNENIAWALVEKGKLLMRNDLMKAKDEFERALILYPKYTPALIGLGKVMFFKGDYFEAEKYFLEAYSELPLAEYATNLADFYAETNNQTKSKQYIALTELAFGASARAGVNNDLEEAIFMTDNDLDIVKALEKLKRAYEARPSIYSADALSWALYKKGDIGEAVSLRPKALALGEHDPIILFHQGVIAIENNESVLGSKLLKKAYELHPNFSIKYSSVLREKIN